MLSLKLSSCRPSWDRKLLAIDSWPVSGRVDGCGPDKAVTVSSNCPWSSLPEVQFGDPNTAKFGDEGLEAWSGFLDTRYR